MWPFPKRPKARPLPLPSWMKWVLLGFAGFALYAAQQPIQSGKSDTTLGKISQARKNVDAGRNFDWHDYKRTLFPENGTALEIKQVKPGDGPQAVCGQKVAVAYQAYLVQGNEIDDQATREKPLTFRLGENHVMPVFEKAAGGMKVGEMRSVVANPLMSYGLKDYHRDDVPPGASTRFEIELLSANPPLPEFSDTAFRLFDTAIGKGGFVICGDEVNVDYTVWDIQGKRLYSSRDKKEPLAFTVGASEVPMALDEAVIGMREGGLRMMIMPPELQKTISGASLKPTSFVFPPKQILLVEVEIVK